MDLSKQFQMVFDFQEVMQQPQSVDLDPATGRRFLRENLQDEEMKELLKAYKEDDKVEMADGIIDSIYISIGTCLLHGFVDAHKYIKAVFDDMELMCRTGFPCKGEKKPNLEMYNQINSVFSHSYLSYELPLTTIQSKLCFRLCWYIDFWLYGEKQGWFKKDSLKRAFLEVHTSNMSKLDDNGNPIFYTEGEKKGKVKKSHNFVPPNMKQFVEPNFL